LTYRGKTGRFKMRVALANAGPVQIELMQPLYDETIYDEFAQRKGYGLHHLGIRTDNSGSFYRNRSRQNASRLSCHC